MILTHTGALGDFGTSLIIPNYYWKRKQEKTTFVLSDWFKQIIGLEELLLKQEFTEQVLFDPFVSEFTSNGAQPYKFKTQVITNDEVYYNLGIGSGINRYLGIVYAREYGLGFDMDVQLNFIDPNFPMELRGQKLYTPFLKERYDKDRYVTFFNSLPEKGYVSFDFNNSLLHNLNLAYYSQETVFYPNGFSVFVNLCGMLINQSDTQCKLTNCSTRPDTYYISKNQCSGLEGAPSTWSDPFSEDEYRIFIKHINDTTSREMKDKSDVLIACRDVFNWIVNQGSTYIQRTF